MLQQFRTAITLFVALTILTGGVYPLVVTVVAQTIFPHAAHGSLIVHTEPRNSELNPDGTATNRYDWSRSAPATEGQVPQAIGSELIGQPFSKPAYFWGRLSATGPFPYNAAASSGSNLGPLNPALKDAVSARIAALKASGSPDTKIPVDLVTASGSGLDPQISPAAAEFQVARVASARGMKEYVVRDLVARHTDGRQWGLFGEPRVNVLGLNLALDRLQHER